MAFGIKEFPFTSEYDSDLREILKFVKSFEDRFAEYDETIEKLQAELQNISGLYDRVTNIENAITDLSTIRENIKTLQSDLTALGNLENAHYEYLLKLIKEVETNFDSIDEKIQSVRYYIDSVAYNIRKEHSEDMYNLRLEMYVLFNGLKKRLEILAELVAKIQTNVPNPWRQELGDISLKRNINFIYNDLADECLTAEQYCKLGLDADDYTSRDITAREYAEFGKTKLHWNWVYSPVYGWKQEISNVLTSILNFMKGTLSADEYTALDIDADAYTALDLTASEYYSYGTGEGYLRLGQTGITAGQYSTIGV